VEVAMKHCPKCRIYYPNAQAFCNEDGAILSLKDQYGLNGRIINDKYLIEALVGVGGMSAVYCAQQFGVVRRVAFKILLPHLAANNEKMVSFFEREARTAGRLLHENIATVFDAGRTDDDMAYIVMEWLDGVTLEEELRKKGVFGLERINSLLKQIAGALEAAHAQRVIHRDLKPSNIMLIKRPDGEEQVKVLDFGLAKLATETSDLVSHAVGTPHYASPEQFQLGSEIDVRTDIYSLGVVLYQLLSGRLPFSSQSIHEVIRMHMLEMPRPIRELRPDIPPGIEELLQRMMAKTPHYRPPNVREVATLFERAWLADKERQPAMPSQVDADFLSDISLVDGLVRNATVRRTGDLKENPATAPLSVFAAAAAAAATQADMPTTPPPPMAAPASPPPSPLPQLNSQPGKSPLPGFSVSYTNTKNNTTQALGNTTVMTANLQNVQPVPVTSEAVAPENWLAENQAARPESWLDSLLFTWKKHSLYFAVIGLVLLIAFIGYKFLQPGVKLTEADMILVADFVNTTQDEVFDGALKQALTIQLAQTPFLHQLLDDKVRETLKYMGRKPEEKLTRAIAREVCQRQGVRAFIIGRIDKLDQQYAIRLEAVSAPTGETVAQVIERAGNRDHVLKALDQATTELRGALGESLQSIKKFNKPTEYATTASLEALKAYSSGRDANTFKGNPSEALAFYKRAVDFDPSFALAYVGQASIYANQGQTELSAQAAERAFALRERVSEQEKITISLMYYLAVTGEVDQAIEALKLARQTYPRTISPPINLSVCYGRLGQFTEALHEAEEANQLDPRNSIPYSNRAELLIRLDQYDGARQVLEKALEQKLDRFTYHGLLYQLGWLRGDTALMEQQVEWARGKPDEFRAYDWRAQAAAAQGQLQASGDFARQSMELARQRNLKEAGAAVLVTHAAHALLLGAREQAAKALEVQLSESPNLFKRFTVGTVAPYATVTLAMSGKVDLAQQIVEETMQRQPRNTLAQQLWLPTVRAAIALQKNDPATALEALQATHNVEAAGYFYPTWLRGQAYLRLKQGREAMTEFERIRTHRGWDVMSPLHALAQLELARAYKLRGDTTLARQAYDDFLTQWKDADNNLPLLMAARKEAGALK
jgi:serine/threonine protein kinase/tetratricopeptide (TPR) repeat protein